MKSCQLIGTCLLLTNLYEDSICKPPWALKGNEDQHDVTPLEDLWRTDKVVINDTAESTVASGPWQNVEGRWVVWWEVQRDFRKGEHSTNGYAASWTGRMTNAVLMSWHISDLTEAYVCASRKSFMETKCTRRRMGASCVVIKRWNQYFNNEYLNYVENVVTIQKLEWWNDVFKCMKEIQILDICDII